MLIETCPIKADIDKANDYFEQVSFNLTKFPHESLP